MKWLNLQVSTMRHPEFIGASPAERGVWISLLSYCVDLENGGCIAGGGKWKSRQWEQSCGVTLAELRQESELWSWEDDDLTVWGYPSESEAVLQARRAGGKKGGRPRKDGPENHAGNLKDNLPQNHAGNPKISKGKEREEKESEGNGEPVSAAEAFAYARNLPVMPRWTEAMVAYWHADRSLRGWITAGGVAISVRTWRHDLTVSHAWAAENTARTDRAAQGSESARGAEKKEGGGAVAFGIGEPSWDWRTVAARLYGEGGDDQWDVLPEAARHEILAEKERGAA